MSVQGNLVVTRVVTRAVFSQCKRASSAAVETVYSGATKLSDEAQSMADTLLAAYVFNHYNWQYTSFCARQLMLF